MKGLMMDYQLTLPTILRRAETLFGKKEIVTCLADKTIHRYTYLDFARRSKKLATALRDLGIRQGDRVATLVLESLPAPGSLLCRTLYGRDRSSPQSSV